MIIIRDAIIVRQLPLANIQSIRRDIRRDTHQSTIQRHRRVCGTPDQRRHQRLPMTTTIAMMTRDMMWTTKRTMTMTMMKMHTDQQSDMAGKQRSTVTLKPLISTRLDVNISSSIGFIECGVHCRDALAWRCRMRCQRYRDRSHPLTYVWIGDSIVWHWSAEISMHSKMNMCGN